MKRVVVLAALLFAGCGAVEQFRDVQQQAERAADVLEKELGARPALEWHVSNGSYLSVNVVIKSSLVHESSVSDLEAAVHRALSDTFRDRPQEVVISLRSTPESVGQVSKPEASPQTSTPAKPAV